MSDRRGLFITLDGIDGCGKTTQITPLADYLRSRGLTVTTCRDPGGTRIGDAIRELLLDARNHDMVMRTEMFLYMASRSQLVQERIRPALQRGEAVVSDRFLLANVVYQGIAGGLGEKVLWEIGRVATDDTMPDLSLVLDLDPEAAARRQTGLDDRIQQRGLDFQRRVREGFLACAESRPQSIKVITAERSVEAVQAAIRKEVDRVVQPR